MDRESYKLFARIEDFLNKMAACTDRKSLYLTMGQAQQFVADILDEHYSEDEDSTEE